MDRPTAETTAIVTFVVRFWREWSAGQPRWRGRVEHVESRQRGDFLHLSDLLGFLGCFGIDLNDEPRPSDRKEGHESCD